MMQRYGSLLCVDACSEHIGRAEQDADCAFVHSGYHGFAGGFCFGFLYEADFRCGDAVVFNQFAFDFAVGVEFSSIISALGKTQNFVLLLLSFIEIIPYARLVGAKVGKDELRTFLRIVFLGTSKNLPPTSLRGR